jgi:glycosyltransferase involved in cell wall biosynthesis
VSAVKIAALRGRKAASDVHQFDTILREHLAFRRDGGELGDVLRAYGDFHCERAARVRWEMSEVHSVVLTAHNHAAYLEDSLDSVWRQDHRPLDLIVVDDASSDDTQDVLRRLLRSPRPGVTARVLRNRRSLGQTGAINLAALAARGSVLTMVDADDYMLGGTISAARRVMAEQQAFLFGGGADMFWGELPEQRDLVAPPGPMPLTVWTPAAFCADPTTFNVSHTGSTFLLSAWRCVQGYRRAVRTRITFAADREFHLRVAALFTSVETALSVSHWRQGSSVNLGRYR